VLGSLHCDCRVLSSAPASTPALGPFFDFGWHARAVAGIARHTMSRNIPDSPATFLVEAKQARDSLMASSFQRRQKRAKSHQRPFLSHLGTSGVLPMGGDPIIGCSGFVTLPKNRNIPACPDAKRFVRSFGQLIDLYRIGAILLGSPMISRGCAFCSHEKCVPCRNDENPLISACPV
jgi:hypothetical protein